MDKDTHNRCQLIGRVSVSSIQADEKGLDNIKRTLKGAATWYNINAMRFGSRSFSLRTKIFNSLYYFATSLFSADPGFFRMQVSSTIAWASSLLISSV